MTRSKGARALLALEAPEPPRRSAFHVGVVYPGSYAESASSLGVHFLLSAIRSAPGLSAARILAPDPGDPPVALEDGSGPGTFPVLLVSAAYELQVGPLVDIMGRSGIPLLAADRDSTHPIVVAGGTLARSNPDLLSPLADVVVRGDGEQAIRLISALVAGGARRDTILGDLRRLDGTTPGTLATCPASDLPARSAFVSPNSVLPSMHLVEVMRGCPHACSFCIMSRRRTAAPTRFVPAGEVLAAIPAGVRRVGLVGPSVLDHPEMETILSKIASLGLEASISSARADRVDAGVASLLSVLGMRTLTVALDGPSARIRRAIHKSVRAEDVVAAARTARATGIGRLKLYAMLGFESEGDDDIRELSATCLEIASLASLSISVGPAVPKKGTPLESSRLVGRDVYDSRVRGLRRVLGRKVRLDAVPWREARDEALLSLMSEGDARDLYRAAAGRRLEIRRVLRDLPDP